MDIQQVWLFRARVVHSIWPARRLVSRLFLRYWNRFFSLSSRRILNLGWIAGNERASWVTMWLLQKQSTKCGSFHISRSRSGTVRTQGSCNEYWLRSGSDFQNFWGIFCRSSSTCWRITCCLDDDSCAWRTSWLPRRCILFRTWSNAFLEPAPFPFRSARSDVTSGGGLLRAFTGCGPPVRLHTLTKELKKDCNVEFHQDVILIVMLASMRLGCQCFAKLGWRPSSGFS